GERVRVEAIEEGADVGDQAHADLVGRDLLIQQPFFGGRVVERLGQELVLLDHLDAALAHLVDEVLVVAPGDLDPGEFVEQQLILVGRGQALVGQARRADQDLPQLADLGVDAVRGRSLGRRVRHDSLRYGCGPGDLRPVAVTVRTYGIASAVFWAEASASRSLASFSLQRLVLMRVPPNFW